MWPPHMRLRFSFTEPNVQVLPNVQVSPPVKSRIWQSWAHVRYNGRNLGYNRKESGISGRWLSWREATMRRSSRGMDRNSRRQPRWSPNGPKPVSSTVLWLLPCNYCAHRLATRWGHWNHVLQPGLSVWIHDVQARRLNLRQDSQSTGLAI